MSVFVGFVVWCLALHVALSQKGDSNLNFIKSVSSNRYPVESHEVHTEDGYILTIFRLPSGRNSTVTGTNPVLLNHGMLGSAENWIALGPKRSLGYILADAGYDVWMMNCRGTGYSRKHEKLNPDEREFWQFSWHEIGVFDIPAVIDHILSQTNETMLNYIGHSQGCTSVFVMGSDRPEYNDKIRIMIGLAPGVFYRHFKNDILKLAANYNKVLENFADSMRIYELPPPFMSADELRNAVKYLCVDSSLLQNTCSKVFMLLTESKPYLYDSNSLKQIYSMMITSVSVKQAIHYAQLVTSGNFQQYDWGPQKNLQKYGTEYPPLYNLNNITFPAALFYSKRDTLVSEENVKLLATKLPNLVGIQNVPEDFTHYDFILAKYSDTKIFRPIMRLLNRFNNKRMS
ncbi:unnamed protein product [Phyllotreta striolata]|uniref:Lipase n=1 Tax=Phyllotreta striolata TaxID=444603 RepID=A0A9N9TRD0_PHYSR|nr:unnamed protein product [Phyllotreta striolata]